MTLLPSMDTGHHVHVLALCSMWYDALTKSKVLADLYARLGHSLIRANAAAILTRSYSRLVQQVDERLCNCLYCVRLCVHI